MIENYFYYFTIYLKNSGYPKLRKKMGISGLLPFLKEASTSVNIKEFQGSTVAVDTYCWIYRGAFGCAEQLALGQPADGSVFTFDTSNYF